MKNSSGQENITFLKCASNATMEFILIWMRANPKLCGPLRYELLSDVSCPDKEDEYVLKTF